MKKGCDSDKNRHPKIQLLICNQYSMDSEKIQQIIEKLSTTGWKNIELGYYKSNANIKQIQGFQLFIRTRNFDSILFSESNAISANPHKHWISDMGSVPTMGDQKGAATPVPSDQKNRLSCFDRFQSLANIKRGKKCILIGYDSEWENLKSGKRNMLTWQFATIHNNELVEFCFLKNGKQNLSLDIALGCILDFLNVQPIDVRSLRKYEYCVGWINGKPITEITNSISVARKNCIYVYDKHNEKFTDITISSIENSNDPSLGFYKIFTDYQSVEKIKLTILCHAGKADLTALHQMEWFLPRLTEVQGGLISLQPIRMNVNSLQNVNNSYVYPLSINVGDTMCHAPASMKKLKNLGDVIGIPKIDIPEQQKNNMLSLLESNPCGFFEYASTDSIITLLYSSALYGINNIPPVTMTSVAAEVMKGKMMKRLHCNNTKEFNRVYRGLQTVSHGLYAFENRPGYVESSSLEPISDIVNTIQYYASQAFHGGYNSCSEVGYFNQDTYDYDLKNAYPTAMCLIPDIDWEKPVRSEVIRREMDIREWSGIGGFNPTVPFVGYIRFRFPDNVKYPCIPINVDGIPIYPKSSDGIDGVYAAGPYIYLALKLGATVYCERGYFLYTLYDDDFTHESRSLAYAVKQFVSDRNLALDECGKDSLEELVLKTMANAGYGKNAQNVIQKQNWSAYKDMMSDIGCSAITNPVSAMMTTALVQCELLAAQNQTNNLDYMACSVTTDGFITNCPEDELKALDLYGFRKYMEQARLFLTDGKDSGLWVRKHWQNDLINFTTRGNISLSPNGVCAHNSAKSGYESDSYEDRLWLMTQVLSRTGPIECTEHQWTAFKDIIQDKVEFSVSKETRKLHMDFDMKRKPDRTTLRTDYPIVNGVTYEIAHIETLPYDTIEEFRAYRKKKALCECIRTEDDWFNFFLKIDTNACGAVVKDINWSILSSIIMGYRAGKWDIPALNNKTTKERIEWINTHNSSSKKYTENDWKNARRPERQVNMLPLSIIQSKLEEMQNAE